MAATIVRSGFIERYIEAIRCDCGGYAERAEPTPEEAEVYDWCGRYRITGYACCAAAYVCGLCEARIVGRYHAPEMG